MAAICVQSGKENDARDLLYQKNKTAQTLKKTKSQIELLDELSTKLIEFFWVDASAFPLFVPWHNNKTLRKDPHPKPTEFNAEVCDFLATHIAPFWKFPEPFLCLVGISRYYELDENVYLVFLTDDDEEMDLFAFINHAYRTKVRIGEKQIEEGQTPLLESTRGRVVPLAGVNEQENQNYDVHDVGAHVVQDEGVNIVADEEVEATIADKPKGSRKKRKAAGGASGSNLPPKKLREDHGTSGVSTGGKFIAALKSLLERSTLVVKVGVTAVSTVSFVTSFVTLTPKREGGERIDSITGPNLRTQHPAERFVILSDSPCHSSSNATDAEVSSVVRSLVPDPPIMTTVVAITIVATTVVADTSSVLVPKADDEPVHASIFADSTSIGTVGPDIAGPSQLVGTEISANTFYLSHDMDSETLHQVYVPKWNMVNESALDDPDVCRSLVDQFAPPVLFFGFMTDLVKEKDVEIANLKAQLSLKEAKVAEAIRLHGQVSVAEAAKATRVTTLESAASTKEAECASLSAQTAKLTQDLSDLQLSFDELNVKAASLESQKDNLASQDEQVKIFSDKVAGLDVELTRMALHLDEEFYPRYLTTIAGRQWILSRGLKLVVMKCLQSPEYLAALGKAIVVLSTRVCVTPDNFQNFKLPFYPLTFWFRLDFLTF
ncbi:hypothetical protein Tco_0820547 [Tanacetum coccineum]|uniref:Transposase (Putative), gypsy type n=1 Tax=Tanacetum coccineum TaxID=301880 RepID=A0ABQ5AAP9_9ASTR